MIIVEPLTSLVLINLKTGLLEIAKSQSIKAIDIFVISSYNFLSSNNSSKNPFIILHLLLFLISISFTFS